MTESLRIEFPCEYPIKVIAENHPSIREIVLNIVAEQAPDFLKESIDLKNSRAGTYCSIRVTIIAKGERHLKALHQALLKESLVRLVL